MYPYLPRSSYISPKGHLIAQRIYAQKFLQASETSVEMVANWFRGKIILEDVEVMEVSALLHYSKEGVEGSQKMYLLTSVLTNTRSVKLQK